MILLQTSKENQFFLTNTICKKYFKKEKSKLSVRLQPAESHTLENTQTHSPPPPPPPLFTKF